MSNSTIDLDEIASPAVLGSLIGVSPARVYQLRQIGELPNRDDASYRETLNFYITFLRNRLKSRATPAAEEKIIAETKVLNLREDMMIIELANMKKQYLNAEELYTLFLPLFQLMHSSFSSIAKKFPEATEEVDSTLKSLETLGDEFLLRASALETKFKDDLKSNNISSLEELDEFIEARVVDETE